MPPKSSAGNKKQQEKKVNKIVEDKTFGMKNKGKSKKVQQYVATVQNHAKHQVKGKKVLKDEETRKAEKLAAKKDPLKDEIGNLFQQVVTTKQVVVPPGVDPKSIICAYFKAGNCTKGTKCKFSHDLAKERKVAKIDLYHDQRNNDTIDNWDQTKLESVISEKIKTATPTTIVCKHFLDAIENMKYGWFWECPTGLTCHYRHALPPGYVFKNKKQMEEEKKLREEEDADKPTLYDEIEELRKKLDISKCTPVTPETFAKWKEDRKKQKEIDAETKRKEAEKKDKSSRGLGALSGRELFRFDPTLFVDDDGAADDNEYEVVEEQEEEKVNQDPNNLDQEDDVDEGDGDEDQEGEGEGDEDAEAEKSKKDAVPIDEDLFTAEEELPEEDE